MLILWINFIKDKSGPNTEDALVLRKKKWSTNKPKTLHTLFEGVLTAE